VLNTSVQRELTCEKCLLRTADGFGPVIRLFAGCLVSLTRLCKTLTLQQPADDWGVNEESTAMASDGNVLQFGEYVQCNNVIACAQANHEQVIKEPNGAGTAGAWT
jgi:hypothetical protein